MTSALQQKDMAHVIHPFTDMFLHERTGPLVLDRGEGVYVYDENGNKYLDAMSALWCTGLGYSEERLINTAIEQMRKLPFYHIFNNKSHAPVAKLAEKLCQIAPQSATMGPMHKVFFAN
jgi:4-aminobutyrate--pyruvate transaminase